MEDLTKKVQLFATGLVLFGGLAISDGDDQLVSEKEIVLAESELEKCLDARLFYHFKIKKSGCGAEYTDHSYRLEMYGCQGEEVKAELGHFLREENIIVAKDGKRFMVKEVNGGYEIVSLERSQGGYRRWIEDVFHFYF